MLRLEEILKEKGIGITELAERLGVNRQTVYYYIKQDDKNPLTQLKKIAEALEVKLSDLFEKKESDIIGFLRVHGYLKQVSSLEDLKQLVEDIETGKI